MFSNARSEVVNIEEPCGATFGKADSDDLRVLGQPRCPAVLRDALGESGFTQQGSPLQLSVHLRARGKM